MANRAARRRSRDGARPAQTALRGDHQQPEHGKRVDARVRRQDAPARGRFGDQILRDEAEDRERDQQRARSRHPLHAQHAVHGQHGREDQRAQVVGRRARRQKQDEGERRGPIEPLALRARAARRQQPQAGRENRCREQRLQHRERCGRVHERVRVQLRFEDEQPAQHPRQRAHVRVVRIGDLGAQHRPRNDLPREDAPGLDPEQRDPRRRDQQSGDRHARQRAPAFLAHEEQDEPGRVQLHRSRYGQHRAGAHVVPAEIAPGRHGQQEKNEQVLLPELEVGPQRHDRQEANQRDPAERLPGDRAQQPADGREQQQVEDQPDVLGREGGQRRQRRGQQRREHRERHEADQRLIEPEMILLPLQPFPVVEPVQRNAVSEQPAGEIVVGKIGEQVPPRRQETAPDEQPQRHGEQPPFQPGWREVGAARARTARSIFQSFHPTPSGGHGK